MISIVGQGALLGLYVYVAILTNPGQVSDLMGLVAITPLALMITTLPISPGGLGVGHLAFAQLYLTVGIDNGADVFNTVFIGTICMNLLGLIPYLTQRSDFQIQRALKTSL